MARDLSTTFDGVRNATRDSRVAIGFEPRDTWQTAPALYDEHTLNIQGHPVMEDWEDNYMRLLAEIAVAPGETVLEIGFGMGISARYVQWLGVERHIIIEANREVYERLEGFASVYEQVEPKLGFWEDVVATLPSESITGILFDTYPLSEDEIHQNHFSFFKEAYRLLAPGGVLTYYSDEIDSFSPAHRAALKEAGFSKISRRVCRVYPPSDCKYWRSKTLLAPIVRK